MRYIKLPTPWESQKRLFESMEEEGYISITSDYHDELVLTIRNMDYVEYKKQWS